MSEESLVPATRVLAIASHVVHGYVGNTMATFVMQSLGCEVSAINTVNFSNHTAYKQVKGAKTSAAEILDLYDGLRQSFLNDFSVMLSGYIPSAEAVQAVGKIARDLKFHATTKPGSFFWVLDPVMGDNGKLYVAEEIVPAYKSLLREADLILPNQFEAEVLSGKEIRDLSGLATAVRLLHTTYQVPHVLITSLRLGEDNKTLSRENLNQEDTLTVIGSTRRSDFTPRLFRIDIPAFPIFFSGTGDMLAALMVARLREAVFAANLQNTARWISPDDVEATDLPLAKAAEKVLASMHAVLQKTAMSLEEELAKEREDEEKPHMSMKGEKGEKEEEMRRHLRRTKAAEVRVVRNAEDLRRPPEVEKFGARAVELARGDGVAG